MMLSELYGRIGQQLREYGDSNIVRPILRHEGLRTDKMYLNTDVHFVLGKDYIDDNLVDKKYILEFT